ncbi:MAG: hypothetical protein J6Y37_18540 [Paludibacteraceae bacterium]|nr:hypothetical protein [Paludibacteraceae bacterium]
MKPKKTPKQISMQMERIYTLYGRGYGSVKLLRKTEDKVFLFFASMEY